MLSRLKPIATIRFPSIIPRKMSSSNPDDEALFTDFNKKGLITLNRPKQLNALNHAMVRLIYPKLKEWDDSKQLIVMKGNSPKAFCAGGDVVALTNDKTGKSGRDYFRSEYLNNARIASLKVPYVAVMHGIVMGGGVGLSIHGKYRLATETSLFAMPETQIGLFPDVGVSHFLSRMPNKLGMFLALTGHRLKGYDLFHAGVATHFCHSSLLADFETEVLKPDSQVENVLRSFHSASIDKLPGKRQTPFSLAEHSKMIENCFSKPSVEEIVDSLQKIDSEFTLGLINLMKLMSPVSLKVTFEQITRAANLDVFEVLNMDFRLGWRMLAAKDFYEGVRALLVDKDKKPKWQHQSIKDVTDTEVKDYFKPLDIADELNLPKSLLKERF